MTEAAHQMASNPLPPHTRKPGSVGIAAGPEIQIVSETGEPLPIGEIGEVVIRGPNVMSGYNKNPTANEQSFTNGWFRTGDQGYFDNDGYLFLTGRLKEQINRGGEKIAPLEIDQVLLQHPHLRQAVTFAIPHPTLGEEVAAAVVLKPGAELTEPELRRWMSTRLAQFKMPKKTFFVEDIPKGPTGKIQRLHLSKQLMGSSEAPPEHLSEKLEEFLLTLFQQYLKVSDMNKDDSFFMLGGDSILATQIANRLQGLSDSLPLDAVTIFENPTIEELHQYLMANVDSKSLAEFCRET
jgi:acyl-coenzyme A synthetase/AMP-(fatty) acid ligase/aryl carrier-like protein